MTSGAAPPEGAGFSVGVCATGNAPGLGELLEVIRGNSPGPGLQMKNLVVVASECPNGVVSELRSLASEDGRVDVVFEDVRRGKADAINKILDRAAGEFVVFVNSDALPEAEAIPSLLSAITADPKIGAVSAVPVPESGTGPSSTLTEFMWAAHNECSLTLNHMNFSNHSTDELVAFRVRAIQRLPIGLVNDGAYFAGTARVHGYAIKVCEAARVRIKTPTRVIDLIRQRRRILFGHAEVWHKVGSLPKTIETLLVFAPSIGYRLLVKTIAARPRYLTILPVAAITEFSALLLAIWDSLRSSKRHQVWRRYT